MTETTLAGDELRNHMLSKRITQKEACQTTGLSKWVFASIRDKLRIDTIEQGNYKYYKVSDMSRIRDYAKAVENNQINISTAMRVLGTNQAKLYRMLSVLKTPTSKSTTSNERLIAMDDFSKMIEHFHDSETTNPTNSKEASMKEDVLEQFASVKKYSLKDAAKELGISEKELEGYHEDKLGNGKIGFRMEWIEGKPLCFTEICLEQIREYKASLISQHKERLDNRQMEEAVHESLKEMFDNNVNPKFSKISADLDKLIGTGKMDNDYLLSGLKGLRQLITEESAGIKAAQSEVTSELHHNMDALAKAVQLLQNSMAGIEERLIQHTETLAMILDPLTDPNTEISVKTKVTSTVKPPKVEQLVVEEKTDTSETDTKPDIYSKKLEEVVEDSSAQGEPWYPNAETHQPALKPTESVEDFDSTFRKMGPENLRFNNTLTYDECKKALDMYKVWITSGKLPSDRKLRKLTELANHIRHRLRSHFKSNPNGMTMTEFSNNVKASGPWASKTTHAVKRAALGLLHERDELTIVFGKADTGRAPTFLFYSEDYTQLTLSQAKQGLINPNGFSDLPN